MATPTERLEATRLGIEQVLEAGPWPELKMARRAARQMSERYPLATVVVVVAGVALVLGTKPWRWLRPSAAVKVALAQLAWRSAEGLMQAAVQARTPMHAQSHAPAQGAQATASKNA